MDTVVFGLNAAGLIITLWGLLTARDDLFPLSPTWSRRLRNWVGRLLRRQKTTYVTAHPDTLRLRATVNEVLTHGGVPEIDAPFETWRPYLLRRIADAEAANKDLRSRLDEAAAATDRTLEVERATWQAEIGRLRNEDLPIAVGGVNGRGLQIAALGVFLGLIATILDFSSDYA